MKGKLDLASLLLFTALLFGAVVRFYPVLTSGFPLNDGGMFYAMSHDLRTNGFALPEFTTYNHAGIPFAYPPFGFYVAALLSVLTPDANLWVFHYVPATVNFIAILAFYFFSKELLNSRPVGASVTLFFALFPAFFTWQVMGGGMTRSFGFIFWLLMLRQTLLLFKDPQVKHLLPAILFGSVAVTSHPQIALQAVLSGAVLFLLYGLNKRGLIFAALFGLGVAVFTSPWWFTVLARHGMDPFLSAGSSSPRSLEGYLELFSFNSLDHLLMIPLMPLAIMGFFETRMPKRDKTFLAVWAVVMWLADPRGSGGVVILMLLLTSGWGLVKLSKWIHRLGDEQAEAALSSRAGVGILSGLSLILLFGAIIMDFRLVNTTLNAGSLEMIDWVKANVEGGKTFALVTGREFSMSDPLQEWFPVLTGQKSLSTMQGLEWILKDDFFDYYEQTSALQKCADVTCLDEWILLNNRPYDYLVVTVPPDTSLDESAETLRGLGVSVRSSDSYVLLFESDNALVFERNK